MTGQLTAVRDRYAIIARDERHKWVSLVMTSGPEQTPAAGWTNFLESTGLPTTLASAASYVRNIFLAFRERK